MFRKLTAAWARRRPGKLIKIKSSIFRRLVLAGLLFFASAGQAEHYTVPLLVPAGTSSEPQGVVRILNGTDESGTVEIYAIDDAGTRSGAATFTLNASAAVQFTATDLASGNATLGLTGGIGTNVGDARVQIETDLSIVPLAFVRAADGTLSAMHDTVRGAAATDGSDGYTYEVPIFNPASDATQVSRLRLINPGDAAAAVTIGGRDDSSAAATGGDVTLTLAAGGAQTLTAQQLEAGDTAITGQLGAGTGKWRLTVSSDQPLQVVNIVAATAGYWNNLSTTAVPGAAPADLESLNERFVGNAVVYVTGSNRFTLNAQTGERFTETEEIDGVSTTYMGSYDYAVIGPDAGRMTLTYDDGDVCGANLYFSTHTAGWFASHCTGTDYPADGTRQGGTWSVEDGEGDGGEVTDTTYGVDEALPGVPTSGQFEPATTSGASVTATADGTTIALNDGGYFELSDGTRYTCTSADGCAVANGTVTQGTVAGRAAGSGEVDRFPSFRAAVSPGDQTYTVGTAIDALTLPEASGGNGTLAYSLSPNVPGLTFSATARQLTGTPSTAGTYAMTYTVADEDDDTDTLSFTITVSTGTTQTGSLGECYVSLSVIIGQSCTYPGTTDAFSVNVRGRGSFLTFLAGIRIRIDNQTINGRVYDLLASHQGDGVWRIDRIAGSSEVPETPPMTGGGGMEPEDTSPSFAADAGPGNQTYTVGTAIATLTLPEASGGDGTLTYSLSPNMPGLTFNATARQLSGTPTTAASYNMTYTVTDDDGDTDALNFAITVASDTSTGMDGEAQTGLLALSGCTDGRYVDDPSANPGLVGDCRAVVGFANALAEVNELPDDHILRQWGMSEQVQIGSWIGIGVSGGRVTQLNLNSKQLTGSIPPEIGGLTALWQLDIAGNQLTGAIPSELGNLTGLRGLYLYGNRLSGSIPPEIGGLSELRVMSLGGNELSGAIPPELGNLTNLTILFVHRNRLTGAIPPELGNLINLRRLYLNINQLTGAIPTELASLADLQELALGNNRLSGTIPRELGGLTALQLLDLGGNELTGPIPLEIGGLTALRLLILARNGLTGAVPAELGALINLTSLDLSSNALTDISLLALNAQWGDGVQIDLRGNPLNDESLDTHIPALMARGVAVNHDLRLADEFPDSRLVHVYNDNVIVMQVDGDLTAPPTYGSLATYAADFYGWFEDDFDYLLFVSNLPNFQERSNFGYAGIYYSVMNDTDGIGASKYLDSRFGSAGRLRGVVHFPYPTALQNGPSLHELLHAWANYTVPTAVGAHWGFSSANGQLGGFDIANLVDLGGGRWSAGDFGTFANYGNALPYSPIELYLAGLLPREEVPDLWVAEDGEWLLDEFGQQVSTDDGELIFTSDNVQTVSIADIVAEHGERDPPMAERPHQRAAVILLVDDDHRPSTDALQTASEHAAWLSFQGNDEISLYNYHEATGGRGTLTLDGLSGVRKSEAAGPADLPASFGVPPPPRLTTMDELCGGYVQTALMDGLSSKHKAPATRVVSLCNASPSGSFEVVRYPWSAPGDADDPGARDSLVPSR